MELHQLRYFLAVAKCANFSRAAEACHVAQPSLSQQILKLEHELGEALFERRNRKAVLTPAGHLFRERAARVLGEIEEARREVRDAGAEPQGKVDLGALPTIAPFLLPKLLHAFSARYPRIEIVVHEETTMRILDDLDSHQLDLALISLPIAGARFETQPLFDEELLLVLPEGHRFARRKSISLADLEPEKFILMKDAHCLGTQALQFCKSQGFSPRVSCHSAQMETVQALVEIGLGISLVPAMARRRPGAMRIRYRSVAGTPPHRSIGLVWSRPRQLSRAVCALRDFVAGHAASAPFRGAARGKSRRAATARTSPE